MSSSLTSPKICTAAAAASASVFVTCKKSLQIRAQIPRDHEGRSSNIVDANLHLLKVRVEEVRKRERLERCCKAEQGWNYAYYDNFKSKRDIHQEILVEFVEIVGVIASTFGITVFGCSLCLCLISLLLHLNQ